VASLIKLLSMRPKHVIGLNAAFCLVAVQNRWTSRERPLIPAPGLPGLVNTAALGLILAEVQ
jgi:hypothetical protein